MEGAEEEISLRVNRGFKGIWIPKEIWLNTNLTMQEKVFLVEIDSLDNEGGCTAGNQYFAEFFGISKTRVSLVIQNLISKGYITSKLIYKEGSKQILYRVLKICRPPYPTFVIEGIQQKLSTPIQQKLYTPIQQKLIDNNTVNNNTINNNTNNNINNIKYDEIINYLNLKLNSNYKSSSKETRKHIKARLEEGFTIEDFKTVIDKQYDKWINTEWQQYLRPSTLFGTKFEGYLNAVTVPSTVKVKEYKSNNNKASIDDLYAMLEGE